MLSVSLRYVRQALESLTDIKLAYLEDAQPGFKLIFKFATNDFFENAELEKTYYYQEEVGYGGDFGESC
jgi:nucleosome assembly protein 1-like 1